jgi:hypothetical protein
MYKIEIAISGQTAWLEEETVTIETNDFEKIQIISEFIEFQEENGWDADYELVEYEDAQCDEEAEEEDEVAEEDEKELEVGDIVEDEDGLVWELVG